MTQLTREERETVIVFNESDKEAEVFTYNGRMQRDLGKLAKERPDEVKCIKTNEEGASTYRIPKKWVKVRASRILTEDQMERAVEKARNMNKSNLSRKSNAE